VGDAYLRCRHGRSAVNPGDRFGRWTVIGPSPATARTLVHCRCECGTEGDVTADNLRRGTSKSCGCGRGDANRARAAALPPIEDRFWIQVERDGPVPAHCPDLGPCWLWTGSVDEKGYGRFHDGDRPRKAHDLAYEYTRGPIPNGLEPDHLCRNRPCCNPAHLEAVTHEENCRRAKYAFDRCSQGHLLPEPGLNGRRVCRPCANARNRVYKQRKSTMAIYDAVTGHG